MKFLFLLSFLLLTSCSTYKWVDLDDCKEKVKTLGKCKVID